MINAISFALNAVLGLLNITLVIRYFGIEAQGLVAFAKLLSISGYFALLTLGVPTIVSRKVAQLLQKDEKGELQHWLFSSLILCLAIGTVTAAIGLFLMLFAKEAFFFDALLGSHPLPADQQTLFIGIFSLALPVHFLSVIAQGVLLGSQSFAPIRMSENFVTIGNLLFLLACLGLGGSGVWLAFAALCFDLLRSLFLLWKSHQVYSFFWILKGRFETIRSVFLLELKICFFSSSMGYLETIMPNLIVGHWLGTVGLGIFDTVSKIARVMKTAFGFFNAALMPYAVSLEAESGQQKVVRVFLKMTFLIAFVLLPVSGALAVASESILKIWLGSELTGYGPQMALALLTVVVSIFVSLQSGVFSSQVQVIQSLTWVNFFENLVALPLMIWGISTWGLMGVFASRALVAVLGWGPRFWVVAKAYRVETKLYLWHFRVILPVTLILMLITRSVISFLSGILWTALLLTVFLVASWLAIYYASNQDEQTLIQKIGAQFGVFRKALKR